MFDGPVPIEQLGDIAQIAFFQSGLELLSGILFYKMYRCHVENRRHDDKEKDGAET